MRVQTLVIEGLTPSKEGPRILRAPIHPGELFSTLAHDSKPHGLNIPMIPFFLFLIVLRIEQASGQTDM